MEKKQIEKAKWEIVCLALKSIKALPAFSKNEINGVDLYIKRQDAIDALKSNKLPVTPMPLDEDTVRESLKAQRQSIIKIIQNTEEFEESHCQRDDVLFLAVKKVIINKIKKV